MDFTPLYGKRIFLTGSTGFIGSNIDRLIGWRADVVDPLKYPVTTEKADFIIHAAGYGQPDKFMADPIATIKVNTETLIGLFERLKPGGKFLYLSSSEIYSGSWKERHAEDDIGRTSPWHDRSSYIEGKRCGEAICAAMRTRGVDVKVARLSLGYGPGTKKHDARVLNNFIEQALTQGRITLRDPGDATRTYCYVDDAVEMLLTVLLHGGAGHYSTNEMLHLPADPPVYNVAGVSRTTIRELAETVGLLTGTAVLVPPTDQGVAGAPKHVAVDIDKYVREFGKERFVGLHEGLKRTIEYQRVLYGEEVRRAS